MKKLFAILLLTTHLFNMAGYSLFFQYFINQSDAQLAVTLDNHTYNDNELLEVKVPLNMPYITNTASFERVNGELDVQGLHYNYVKRKVSGDTLYLLCIPNVTKTNLYNAKADFQKANSEAPTGKKAAESLKKFGLTNEYSSYIYQYQIAAINTANTNVYGMFSMPLTHTFSTTPKQPPKGTTNIFLS